MIGGGGGGGGNVRVAIFEVRGRKLYIWQYSKSKSMLILKSQPTTRSYRDLQGVLSSHRPAPPGPLLRESPSTNVVNTGRVRSK